MLIKPSYMLETLSTHCWGRLVTHAKQVYAMSINLKDRIKGAAKGPLTLLGLRYSALAAGQGCDFLGIFRPFAGAAQPPPFKGCNPPCCNKGGKEPK